MDLNDMATEIVDAVGGKENIQGLTHCVTRLRFVLVDESIPDDARIKKIKKVMGVMRAGGQYQVIVGSIVNDAYDAVERVLGGTTSAADAEVPEDYEVAPNTSTNKKDELKNKFAKAKAKNNTTLFNRISRAMVKMIFPIIPTMAAVGILKGLMSVTLLFGWLTTKDGTYILLTSINDAFLYFLPIIIAVSVSKAIGSSPYIGVAIGATLVLPAIVTATTKNVNMSFLGIPVLLKSYGNSLFPTMISTLLAGKFEKYLKKYIPDYLEFLRIMVILIVMVPFTFIVIGPLFTLVSKWLAAGTMGIYNLSPLVAGVLFGAFWQVMVLFGLHYAFIPILTDITLREGSNAFNPILGQGVWALAGAALGFALKTKNKELKATGFSGMTSALFGVTEPSIFGIALPYRVPFISAMIGGAVGGLLSPILKVNQYYPAVAGGILSFGSSMNPNGNPQSVIGYFICFFVAFIISAICSYILTTDKKIAEINGGELPSDK
ncbi:PTS transporter subunit EIIC [Companilactobacillus sp. FL22-1]|uniref:PTS transporter subunit EIIC n=1 Tax=Companilactobacillus sp. FL22-1 TaxID=3373892 RepID=UPI0037552C5E